MAGTDVEAVDFELEDDDLMDEEAGGLGDAPPPKLKSAITGGSASTLQRKTKGRGFREEPHDRSGLLGGREFESLGSDGGPGPLRSIEGWIVLVTGVHEEAQEDDVHNVFSEYGQIKNLHLNLDRRSGFVKGYALIEYEHFEEAQKAISEMNGATLLTQVINVDWAFSNGPSTGLVDGAQGVQGGDTEKVQRLAADPSNVKFPATVLTHARISHALLSDIAPAETAICAPSNRTENTLH
ncbi:hypothetical protein ACFE04_027069 [Oxalis oulophora]